MALNQTGLGSITPVGTQTHLIIPKSVHRARQATLVLQILIAPMAGVSVQLYGGRFCSVGLRAKMVACVSRPRRHAVVGTRTMLTLGTTHAEARDGPEEYS